jgi:hypothetical protein
MSEAWSPREWKTLYAAAMLETDPAQFQQRVHVADAAIRARLTELTLTEMAAGYSENTELQSALKYLDRVKASLTSD